MIGVTAQFPVRSEYFGIRVWDAVLSLWLSVGTFRTADDVGFEGEEVRGTYVGGADGITAILTTVWGGGV